MASKSLEDLLLGDLEEAEEQIEIKIEQPASQTPIPQQTAVTPAPSQPQQSAQPAQHGVPHQANQLPQNANRAPQPNRQIPQGTAIPQIARTMPPGHNTGVMTNQNINIMGQQQVNSVAPGGQMRPPTLQNANPAANNPNNNNTTKQQSFVRFMEIVKTKLPVEQCNSVGEIDKQFVEQKMTFEDYLAQLRQKIGKIKFELLLNQFKSLQNGGARPIPLGTGSGGTTGVPPQAPPQTPPQQRPPNQMPQYPQAHSQPLPNNNNFMRAAGAGNPAAQAALIQQKKRLEPPSPNPAVTEPPNKKRIAVPNRPPSQVVNLNVAGVTPKQKQKDETDMKSFDDVTKIAKINLKEEQKLSLDDEQGPVMNYPSEGKEVLFVNEPIIEKIVKDIALKHSLTVGDQVVEYLSLCLQEKLRGSMEQLISISKQRFDVHKAEFQIEETSDVKKTLRVISERERELAMKKKEEDREKLLNAAKQNKKEKKDDKSAYFRDKLNKVKQEEEEKRTNITALQAAKNPRPAMGQTSGLFGNLKGDLPAYLRQMPNSLSNPNLSASKISMPEVPRQPTRKITLKDSLSYVARDVDLRAENSNFVYRCYLGDEFLKTKHERGNTIPN